MSRYKLGSLTVRDWNAWDRVPRDPVTIGAYILTSVGATTLAASTVAAFAVGYIATTLVTSALLSALTPKPDFGAASAGSGGLPVSYTHLRAHETLISISYAVFCW